MIRFPRISLLFTLLLCLTACKDDPPFISIQPNILTISAEGGNLALEIKSNTRWNLLGVPNYIRASTLSGAGDATVVFTVEGHITHKARNTEIIITAEKAEKPGRLSISQDPYLGNTPPTAPVLLLPEHQVVGLHPVVTFSWEPSSDLNGDEVTYLLRYWSPGESVYTIDCGANTQITTPVALKGESVYEWYVAAADGFSFTDSPVRQFTTSSSNYYAEGEVRTLLKNRPTNGVNLVFLCDGFTGADLEKGGVCDQAVIEALGYFFDVEPYRSYMSYFNAYVVYAYSIDRGASYGAVNTLKRTAFSVTCDKDSRTSTAMASDSAKVFSYAKKAPIGPINETLIVVISQDDRYAGTCWMWSDPSDWGGGKTIALTTMSRNNYPYNFKGTMQHEAGGHGFAKLADEYVNEQAAKDRDRKSVVTMYVNYGVYSNVDTDTTANLSRIRWKEFIGLPDYRMVGAYEGAYYFATGVWRPEAGSCMINNIAYFNAPSRAAIVRRIKKIAKEPFDFEDFLRKDVTTMPTFAPAPPTKLQEYLYLAPPVFVKE